MAIFNSYVKLPEGIPKNIQKWKKTVWFGTEIIQNLTNQPNTSNAHPH
jgi:hypothetical protein